MAEIEVPNGEVVDAPQGEPTGQVEGESSEEVVTLPSDVEEFEVPEKFQGKSTEDVIKAYLELEKMKSKKGGDEEVSQEEKPTGEESSDAPTKLTAEEVTVYEQSFRENGALTEEQYAELEAKGISRQAVDDEIEYRQYKEEKALNKVIEPLGGGKEKLQEVVNWASQTKTSEEVAAFNAALAAAPLVAQQAMLKGLYAEYDASDSTPTVLHSNSRQTTASKGYATEADFMKDISNPAYKTDKSYVKAVEDKLNASNTDNWSF